MKGRLTAGRCITLMAVDIALFGGMGLIIAYTTRSAWAVVPFAVAQLILFFLWAKGMEDISEDWTKGIEDILEDHES